MRTFLICLIILPFLMLNSLDAKDRQITGKVTDNDGNPLSGVTVIVKGTAVGAYTKNDGTYSLNVPEGKNIIIFRQIGRKQKEVTIGKDDFLSVTLEEDKVLMEEVVITAMGLERSKKAIGYSVEEVGGNLITESRATNLVDAMSGKVAGVRVNSSSGTPGASSYITIRGISSITGENQPLFVVDGIPIDNSQSYSGNPDDGRNNLLSGVGYSNRAVDINPDDIEAMTVLKGPAATALYGLRAASGAIIITTKKGKGVAGDPAKVSFTSTLGIDQVNKLPEMQNKWSQGISGSFNQPGSSNGLSWGALIDTLSYNGISTKWDKNGSIVSSNDPTAVKKVVPYDNLDLFFRDGISWTNALSLAGGTTLGSYYLSISNTTQDGIVPKSTFERTTVRLSADANIFNNLKATGTFMYTNSGGRRIQQGSNTSGVMLGLLRTTPTFDNSYGYGEDAVDHPDSYIFADGSQRNYRGGGGYDNPFWTVNRNPFVDDVDRFIGNFQLDWMLTDWFSAMYRVGADIYSDVRKQEFSIASRTVPSGRVFNHNIGNSDLTSEFIMTFTHQVNEDLGGKLLIGHNFFKTRYESQYVQGDGLIIPDFYHVSNTTGQINRISDDQLERQGFYGDLTVDYQQWLYFNGSLRMDQSSSLPKDNNSFVYGQGSASIVFTELFKNVFYESPMNFGKLRLSYAIVGKDAPIYGTTTPFIPGTTADGWTDGVSFPYLGQVGYTMADVLGNDQLKPEKTTSFEFGLQLGFLDNMIGLDFTYYDAKSIDQIFNVPVSYATGYWRMVMNAGEMSNSGYEIVLNATPVRGDLTWDIAVNFSQNKNMVDKLADGVDNIFLGGFQGSSIRAVAGKPYGTIYGFGWMRDDNGNIMIDDDPESADYGFPILDPTEKDFGSAQPDWLMGIRNSLTWNGITFSFLIDIKQGGILWNGTKGALYYFGTHKETENRGYTKVFDGVKSDGSANDIEVVVDENWLAFNNGNGFYGSNTEDFIEDAGWVRLREVSLSYMLPQSLTGATPFKDIMFTVTGRNLWLSTDYTGVDPETSLMGSHNAQGLDYFNMPGIRSYIFSLNVKF